MRQKFALLFALALLIGSAFAMLPAQAQKPLPVEQPAAAPQAVQPKAEIQGELPASGLVKVIVQLSDPPLASYQGGISGLPATSPMALGRPQLNPDSTAVQLYQTYLDGKQQQLLNEVRRFSPQAREIMRYQAAYNGVALELPVEDVARLLKVAGVTGVEVNKIEQIVTDSSPEFIGAPTMWQELGAADGSTAGENVIIGVIDTGIYNPAASVNSDGMHPSLVDPAPVGGDYPSTFSRRGVCAGAQAQDGTFGACNDKLIGAWWYNNSNIANPGEAMSPLDQDGHGTHTATTAGGNGGTSAPLGTISGIAPRARIIAYKVCWDADPANPQDGGCGTIDSLAAINQAIIDGVDVINYSISGGTDPWRHSVEQAFLAAVEAGIVVNASAGNAGTVGSVNHVSPWDITVAASTHSRAFTGTISVMGAVTTTPPGPYEGSSLSPGTVNGNVVLAPSQGAGDPVPSQCLNPYPAGTFQPTDIVICRRGTIARVLKYEHVRVGGAGAGILVNTSPSQSLNADYCAPGFVCLHLSQPDGDAIINYVEASVVPVVGTVSGGVRGTRRGDTMAGFSSKGPAGFGDILKPDVTSVGVDVYAGSSNNQWDDADPNQLFSVISGTSMSSPHSAGASALLRQLHPDWSPMEIKSALMSTAVYTSVLKSDASTPADPFDIGSGRTDLTVAGKAGLILDESIDNMLAADPVIGGDPKTLNLANFANSACVVECTWTRTLKNPLRNPITWNSGVMGGSGITLTVSPASFTIPARGTQVVTVTANVEGQALGGWLFDTVVFTPTNAPAQLQVPGAHFPVAVVPSASNLPSQLTITTGEISGSHVISDVQALRIDELTTQEFGLTRGTFTERMLGQDSNNGSPWDNLSDGVFYITMTVPTDTARLVADITASSSADLDLFVHYDVNGDGQPAQNELVALSATGAVLEYVNLTNPTPGTYIVLVQNWQASSAMSDSVTLSTAVVPAADRGNLDLSGPTTQAGGQPFNLSLLWNEPGFRPGDRWYGAFTLGTNAASEGNLGRTEVDFRITAPSSYRLYLPLLMQ